MQFGRGDLYRDHTMPCLFQPTRVIITLYDITYR